MKHNYINERARKYHYWRGFATASILAVPIILALIYGLNIALKALS